MPVHHFARPDTAKKIRIVNADNGLEATDQTGEPLTITLGTIGRMLCSQALADAKLDAFEAADLRSKLDGPPGPVEFTALEHAALRALISVKGGPKLGPLALHVLATRPVVDYLRALHDAPTTRP